MSEIKPWREYIGKHEAYMIMCDVLNALCEKEAIKKTVYERLKQAPSEYSWIPCSERLPEKVDEYQRRGWYMTTNAYGAVGETRYEFYDDFKRTGWQSDIQIVAWMPLPEQYKGGE